MCKEEKKPSLTLGKITFEKHASYFDDFRRIDRLARIELKLRELNRRIKKLERRFGKCV